VHAVNGPHLKPFTFHLLPSPTVNISLSSLVDANYLVTFHGLLPWVAIHHNEIGHFLTFTLVGMPLHPGPLPELTERKENI
jgi:hypothetical protein